MQVVLAHHPPDSIVTDITQSPSHQSAIPARNIPFPADHSGKCNEADEDGLPIDRARAWEDHVQAEPHGQI
jgi:hypothetical protein